MPLLMPPYLGIWDTVRTDQPLIYLECGHNRWLSFLF
jgi:hypothetical protein